MSILNETTIFPADTENLEKMLRIISIGPNSSINLQVPAGNDWITAKTYYNSHVDLVNTNGKSIRVKVNGKGTFEFS